MGPVVAIGSGCRCPARTKFGWIQSAASAWSRALAILVIGGFLSYAAFTLSPEKAAGTTEALDYVHSLPFGPWLYGTVALGLVAFGAYGPIEARYRTIHAPL